ncbi:MAG TPA: type IV pilus modification protein PilV [Steroidobacteraceae bacterium]|nr:type IV pilus modification protein PilV [Steroidobacteraceae bacterium]
MKPVKTAGFSLIEVLVALIVVSIGLLGIAKIQALAYSSTSTASERSIASLQAASLGAAMRANRGYWAAGAAPSPLTISGTTISDTGLAGNTTSCANSPCTSVNMAAYDLHQWAAAVVAVLPNPVTTIVCGSIPVNCTITMTWDEKTVAVNQQGTGATQGPSYTLFVEP